MWHRANGRRTEPGSDPPSTLRGAAIRSAAYLTGREVLGVGVRLLGLVLVMRKIGPSDFGIYSAAAAYVAFPATLAQMGAEVFLIRQPGPIPRRRYDETFTVLLVVSLVVVAVGMGISLLAAPLLRPHGVVAPMRVLLMSVPVTVLWAPMQARIERRFAFRQIGLLELGGDLVLYGTAVPLAITGAGPWSLVGGFFAWQVFRLIGSMALSGLWPRLAWSNRTARELFVHGRTFSVATWASGVRSSVLTMIVAAYAGAVGVGLVSFAQRLVLTLNFADRGIHRVGLAAISRASESKSRRLSAALEEGTLLLLLISAVPFAMFGLVAHWVVPDVFGRAWLPALPVYVLLALWATLRVPATVQRTLLYAHGKNGTPAITSMLELAIVTVVALVAVRELGIVGYGIAMVVALVAVANTHLAAHRLVALRYRRLVLPLTALVPPVFIPLVPLEWGFFLLLPPGALFAVPAIRTGLRDLVSTAWATVVRRSRMSAAQRPAEERVIQRAAPAAAQLSAAGGAPSTSGAVPALNRAGPVGNRAVAELGCPRSPEGQGPAERTGISDVLSGLLLETDPVTQLPTETALLARLGRLLGAVGRPGWTLTLVGIELRCNGKLAADGGKIVPEELLACVAARLRSEFGFDELLARVGPAVFVVAVLSVGVVSDAARVAGHVRSAVITGLSAEEVPGGGDGWMAQVHHVVVALPSDEDSDELVRGVLSGLAV